MYFVSVVFDQHFSFLPHFFKFVPAFDVPEHNNDLGILVNESYLLDFASEK